MCREQCRLKYIEGWAGSGLSKPLDYGSCVHYINHQVYANKQWTADSGTINNYVLDYHELWKQEIAERGKFRTTSKEYQDHATVCRWAASVVPVYMKRIVMKDALYNDPKREWQSIEGKFKTISATGIPIRGRIDGVYKKGGKLWLLETKNLGRFDEEDISEAMGMNLQVMLYLWALRSISDVPVGGVMYNLMKRPQLRQGKVETTDQFGARVHDHVNDPDKMDEYFCRVECRFTDAEIDQWAISQLEPILDEFKHWAVHASLGAHAHCYANPGSLHMYNRRSEFFEVITRGDYSKVRRRLHVHLELE